MKKHKRRKQKISALIFKAIVFVLGVLSYLLFIELAIRCFVTG